MKRIMAGMVILVWVVTGSRIDGATRTWTGAVNGMWSATNNWNPAGTLLATDALTWDATSTNNMASTNDYASLSVASLTFTAAPEGIVLNGSNLTLTALTSIIGASGQGKATINMNLALPATAALGDIAGVLIDGVVSGAGTSLTTRYGTYGLYGSNSFSGVAILGDASTSGGSPQIINTLRNSGFTQSLGSGNLVQFGSGTQGRGNIVYVGPTASTDKGFQIGDEDSGNNSSSGGVYANGSGPVTWNGVQRLAGTTKGRRLFTLGGFNTDDNAWQGSISNNVSGEVGLVKEGRGKWIVSGANGFTNSTLVNEGITVNSGTLVLDYANTAVVMNPSNRFCVAGGTLELKGNASGVSQSFIALRVGGPSGLSTVRLVDSGAPGISLVFSNGPSIGGALGYAVLLDQGHAANSIVLGVQLPGFTPPFRYLSKSPAGRIDFATSSSATAPVTNLMSQTALTVAGNTSGNFILTNSLTVNGGLARLLRIDPATSNQTLTLNMTDPLTNSVVANTLFVGAYDFTITQASNQVGSLAQLTTPASPAYVYHFGSGKLTLDTKLAGDCNSTSTLSGGVVEFFGTGLIDWTRPANTSNTVLVAGVTLRQNGTNGQKLDNTATGLGSGNIMLANGGLLEVSDATIITRNVGTGAGAVQWLSDGGFSAYGGDRAVNLGGAGATQTWGSAGFVPNNNALVLCRAGSTNSIDFRNPLNLGGQQRVVLVNDGSVTVDAKLSGVLSGTFWGGLVKEGAGTLELTAVNTYRGATWVKAGTLRVSGSTGTGIQGVPDGGLVTVFTNAVITGTGTVYRLAFNGGGKLAPYMTGSGTPSKLRVTGAADLSNGILDLSGLGTLPDGDLTILQCGSRIGAFAATNGLPVDRQVAYTGTSIVLKDVSPQGFMVIVH